MSATPLDLSTTYLRLKRDLSAEPLPVDAEFWPRLMAGALGDFQGEYLVACHDFDATWPSWEMHPAGDEVVVLLSGAAVFVLETAEGSPEIRLDHAGACALVPRGVWHTARIDTPSRLLFITPGEGTRHRPA